MPNGPVNWAAAINAPSRRSVFINCPFDRDYRPLFRATCFAVAACGHSPRCALDESDSAEVRFNRILDLITAADFSIHDVSRVELDRGSGLPRFNMPLELGADLALRLRGPARHRRRRVLVMDTALHRYDQTLSDISGMDIGAHDNDPAQVIATVRDWLNSGRGRVPPLPGSDAIINDYGAFQDIAPGIIARLRLDDFEKLPHADYLYVVDEALHLIEQTRHA